MSTSVVISQIIPTDDGKALDIKGTCGGTAHLYLRENIDSQELGTGILAFSAQSLAAEYLAHYNLLAAGITLLASVSITITVLPPTTTSAIVYGGTPVAEVGYDELEITATVGGTTTRIHMSPRDFLEFAGSTNFGANSTDFATFIGLKLYAQRQQDVARTSYITTFTV